MISNRLDWLLLQPDTDCFRPVSFASVRDETAILAQLQPRLLDAISTLQQASASFPLMLVKCSEHPNYLPLLVDAVRKKNVTSSSLFGGHYHISENEVTWQPATCSDNLFATAGETDFAEWMPEEQLFGCIRHYRHHIQLVPGLVHRINGGTLVLSLRILLTQPRVWLRLKHIISNQRFDWLTPDESRPLPVSVPSMPMRFRLILCGERDLLAEFQEMEPELASLSVYSEFEENLKISNQEALTLWCQWIYYIAKKSAFPSIDENLLPVLMREGVRYTGDKELLPLCPAWLNRQLGDAAVHNPQQIGAADLTAALEHRRWREAYLSQRMADDVQLGLVKIDTEGDVVGQINALSVLDIAGHPQAIGLPSRISCVVHHGDGELHDVEHKAELSGGIHTKGMMIMQAWLISQLQLEQQLPFSASMVFEQSYTEVDGDSASLAELCALISALAGWPVHQKIAVTGSVDQFGNIQAVGGLNEKIEGFFDICCQRGLNREQGVIIPASNVRNLSLHQRVVNAVRDNIFHIWSVNSVDEALPILTDLAWHEEKSPCLLNLIRERVSHALQQETRHRFWPLRWSGWFRPG